MRSMSSNANPRKLRKALGRILAIDAASAGVPSWKVTCGRSLTSTDRWSLPTVSDSARDGCKRPSSPVLARPSTTRIWLIWRTPRSGVVAADHSLMPTRSVDEIEAEFLDSVRRHDAATTETAHIAVIASHHGKRRSPLRRTTLLLVHRWLVDKADAEPRRLDAGTLLHDL